MNKTAYKVKFNKTQPTLLFCIKDDRIEFETVGGTRLFIDDFINLCLTDKSIKNHLTSIEPYFQPETIFEKTDTCIKAYISNAKHDWAKSYSGLLKSLFYHTINSDRIKIKEEYTWDNLTKLIYSLIKTDEKYTMSLKEYISKEDLIRTYSSEKF